MLENRGHKKPHFLYFCVEIWKKQIFLVNNSTKVLCFIHPKQTVYLLYTSDRMDLGSEPGPKMGCVVRGRAPATSLSYHESGSHLFVASEEDAALRVVNCLSGGPPSDRIGSIKLQREGIRTVRATHHGHCVLFASGTQGSLPNKKSVYYLSKYYIYLQLLMR